jgi:hypothetical protein
MATKVAIKKERENRLKGDEDYNLGELDNLGNMGMVETEASLPES